MRFTAVTAALLLSLAAGGAAFAHAKLVSANPPINGVAVRAPQNLDLLFSEEISGKLSGAMVTGAAGPVSITTKTEKNGRGLMVMMKSPLPTGVYTIGWHVVASDDGHKTQGTYKITVH